MRTLIATAMLLAAAGAGASDFGQRHPAGAITDRAGAGQALREADAEEARIARESAAREAECYKAFLVNRCREEVRRDRQDAERELRRVRMEARDLQRRLDAEEAAKKRAEAAAESGKKPAPDTPAARPGRELTPEEAARNRAAYDKRIADQRDKAAQEQAEAAERARNAREFEAKRAEAERRAKEQEARRLSNEERRAERRKRLEQQEAQREEVRRRAEEAARASGKSP